MGVSKVACSLRSPLADSPAGLAAGDGGDDADDLTRGDRRLEVLQEADVLVGDEHVDEAAEAAAVVEDPLAEAGVRDVERLQDRGDRRALDARLRCAAGERTQLRGDPNRDGHHCSSTVNDSW